MTSRMSEPEGRYAPRSPNRDGPWPEPVELPGLPSVPPWHDYLLPDGLRPWLIDIADRIQCPPEYPAVAALVAAASLIGRAISIRPKRCDDWAAVPNLWGAVVGPPGALKSPALSEALRPLSLLAKEAAAHHAGFAFDRETLAARQKALGKEIEAGAREGREVDDARLRHQQLAAEQLRLGAERRFIVNDTTTEKLGEILQANPRGVMLFRDELTGWLQSLDKPGRECDRALYLEAWNGDREFVFDRIGRGTLRIEAACVSLLGGIQPGPMARHLRDALAHGAGADGLLQRLQLLVFPDPMRLWRNVDRVPDTAAREAAFEIYRRLAYTEPSAFGATTPEGGFPFLRFDESTQVFADAWRADLEEKLRSGEEHAAMEAHLAKYRSLMPSLALIFALLNGECGSVGLASAQRAASWCDFLEGHARRLYASAYSDDSAAKLLLAKIRNGALQHPFTARDAYRRHWSGLAQLEDVEKAIEALERHGWVRRVTLITDGRPRVDVQVHPCLRTRPSER